MQADQHNTLRELAGIEAIAMFYLGQIGSSISRDSHSRRPVLFLQKIINSSYSSIFQQLLHGSCSSQRERERAGSPGIGESSSVSSGPRLDCSSGRGGWTLTAIGLDSLLLLKVGPADIVSVPTVPTSISREAWFQPGLPQVGRSRESSEKIFDRSETTTAAFEFLLETTTLSLTLPRTQYKFTMDLVRAPKKRF